MTEERGTLVFVPAWNEEESLPAVLDELRSVMPEADLLVVDDGSTDRTAAIARGAGAEVLSFGENRGLPAGIAAGYAHAEQQGYRFCGRVDADGQHPVAELARLLDLVRAGTCDVAVGSRFSSAEGYAERRYRPTPARQFGHFLLRRLMRWRLGHPVMDATSGLYAVNRRAMPVLAKPYGTGAPEVEAIIRLREAGLTVNEIPVEMRDRAKGASKLTGKKALLLVLTVAATVLLKRRRPF